MKGFPSVDVEAVTGDVGLEGVTSVENEVVTGSVEGVGCDITGQGREPVKIQLQSLCDTYQIS